MFDADELARAAATTAAYFAVTVPGLEPLLAAELSALGVPGRQVHGGVEGRVSLPLLWSIHRYSNLAESVRVRLKGFTARDFATLEERLSRLPWHAYVARGAAVDIRVACHRSKLFHSDAVAQRVRAVLRQRLDVSPPDPARGDAAQRIFLRLSRDEVTTSVDASGPLLYRRGYRTEVGAAPLRETLACAMIEVLRQASAEPIAAVWDPFCGSGVLPLEWLRMARGIAPGASRRFAFEHWPSHPRAAYEHWSRLQEVTAAGGALQAWGSDIADRAIRGARANERSLGELYGGALTCRWEVGDFRKVEALVPIGTAVLANPPYARRIGDGRGVAKLHADFEALLRRRDDLRPVVLACGYRRFLVESQLPWKRLYDTRTGGLNLSLLLLS